MEDNLPVINLEDADLDEGNEPPFLLFLLRGAIRFCLRLEYNFSVMRFRLRGYESGANAVYLNGIDNRLR